MGKWWYQLELEAGRKQHRGLREIRRGMSVGSMRDVGRGYGRLQLVFCYSARDGTGGFELEGRGEW